MANPIIYCSFLYRPVSGIILIILIHIPLSRNSIEFSIMMVWFFPLSKNGGKSSKTPVMLFVYKRQIPMLTWVRQHSVCASILYEQNICLIHRIYQECHFNEAQARFFFLFFFVSITECQLWSGSRPTQHSFLNANLIMSLICSKPYHCFSLLLEVLNL